MATDEFSEFWKAYPRRIAKGAARRIFERSLRLATIEQILVGVANYRKWIDDAGIEEKFVAHPATWLRAERWADEYGTVQPRSKTPTLEEVSKWGKE